MDAMTDIPEVSRNRLLELGYLGDTYSSSSEWELAYKAAADRFQRNHGELFTGGVEGHHGRAAAFDATWGDVSEKLLWMPRDCSCPDISRDADGNEIAKARWPEDCALELEFSSDWSRVPGLTPDETHQGVALALAEWNVAFDSPLNGEVYPEYLAEWQRVGRFTEAEDQFVLWCGTVKHEVGHALGFNHTPNDPDSVMYPSMRGQWLLNRTDLANMRGRGYSILKPVEMRIVDWNGRSGTNIWATLGALPGSTLAWSMLASGTCSQRAEQRYDSTVTWNKTKIHMPPLTPPTPDPPGTPDKPTVLLSYTAKAGEVITVVSGEPDEGGGFGQW